MFRPFKLINYTMTLYKPKPDLRMTADLILSLRIAGSHSNRIIQLSKNTTTIIHHILNGIISLCRHPSVTSYKYVLLGQFTTDPLEKEFRKIRWGSDGIYLIYVQLYIQKSHIKQTSLLLNQNVNTDALDIINSHLVIINFIGKFRNIWRSRKFRTNSF